MHKSPMYQKSILITKKKNNMSSETRSIFASSLQNIVAQIQIKVNMVLYQDPDGLLITCSIFYQKHYHRYPSLKKVLSMCPFFNFKIRVIHLNKKIMFFRTPVANNYFLRDLVNYCSIRYIWINYFNFLDILDDQIMWAHGFCLIQPKIYKMAI